MLESLSSNPICDTDSLRGDFTSLSFVLVPPPPSAAVRITWMTGRALRTCRVLYSERKQQLQEEKARSKLMAEGAPDPGFFYF